MDPRQASTALAERIWNAFPVTQPSFAKLLGLLDIEASTAVPTAAVTLALRSRLLLNPEFVARNCPTDAALVMLVLHELFHVALGHTRLFPRITPAQNIAFDAVINAQLCLLFPEPHWTRLFRECYRADELPSAFLRPPEGWRSEGVAWLPGAVGGLHRRLYSDASASYEDLFRAIAESLEPVLPTSRENCEPGGDSMDGSGTRLLGGHGAPPDAAADPALLEEIRRVIAEWPMVEVRSGRDQGGPRAARSVEAMDPPRAAAALLRRALWRLADLGVGSSGRPRAAHRLSAAGLPYQVRGDRAAGVRRALGQVPLLHHGQVELRSLERGERVHVYLDVSGSMDRLVGPLYAALNSLATLVAPQVHLFSTEVRDVGHAQLRRGLAFTTGGTDISIVTRHLLKERIARALVITDGWVGEVPPEHARELARRKVRIGVAVTAGGDSAFAQALASPVWTLPGF